MIIMPMAFERQQSMNRYSIFSWFSYELPIEERLALIKEAGFDAVMLWWGDNDRMVQPKLTKEALLEVENAHAPCNNANSIWEDNAAGEEYVKTLFQSIEECCELSVPVLVVHITSFREEPEISDLGLGRLIKLVDFAEKKKVCIALENTCFLQPLKYVFDNIHSEYLGFCYDSGHESFSKPYVDWLSMYGDRLTAMHLHDNFGGNDAHLLPFDGGIKWTRVLTNLKNSRPLEFLSFELDFNKKTPNSSIYDNLSAKEYLELAYRRVSKLGAITRGYI